jgi:hypothetical protein
MPRFCLGFFCFRIGEVVSDTFLGEAQALVSHQAVKKDSPNQSPVLNTLLEQLAAKNEESLKINQFLTQR